MNIVVGDHTKEMAGEPSLYSPFESAADAAVNGDVGTLTLLLENDPKLVRARSERPHRFTLLHYLGANGIEDFRQKSPRNAVEIANCLLSAGAEVDALADVYGKSTTLELVASSIHPKRIGVQIALLETLLDHGARMDGARIDGAMVDGIPGCGSAVNPALRNGHPESAEFLARRGAYLDLEAAAGVGWLRVVETFFNHDGSLKANATKLQLESGFCWACEYGRNDVIEFLLERGADLRTQANTGMTGLHWAVVGGQLQTVKMLLEKGAPLEVRNTYSATPLGQALWSSVNGPVGTDYHSIIQSLIRAGSKIDDGSLAWLAKQETRSLSERASIIELLRSHGANS